AYHAINYSAFRPLAFRWLAFLPPSFILITGFLVAQVYAKNYDVGSSAPYVRLATRGFKLFLLFLVLNLAHLVVSQRSLEGGWLEFMDRAPTILFSGNGRRAIFEVLLPISYFLLMAPLLLWVWSRLGLLIPIGASALFIACTWL